MEQKLATVQKTTTEPSSYTLSWFLPSGIMQTAHGLSSRAMIVQRADMQGFKEAQIDFAGFFDATVETVGDTNEADTETTDAGTADAFENTPAEAAEDVEETKTSCFAKHDRVLVCLDADGNLDDAGDAFAGVITTASVKKQVASVQFDDDNCVLTHIPFSKLVLED